jgi:putative transposase
VLHEFACRHGLPEEIVMDNGPEFTGRALFAWSARTGVRLRFIQPGKPIQNAFLESFIGRFRHECLNQHWFGFFAEAARIIGARRQHYERERPPQRTRLRGAGASARSRKAMALALRSSGRISYRPGRRRHRWRRAGIPSADAAVAVDQS